MFRLIILAWMLLPGVSLAQGTSTITSTAAGGVPLDSVGGLLEAITAKNWPAAAGFVIMLVVWALKKYRVLEKIKLGSKWGIRASVVILSALTALAGGLMDGLPPAEVVIATLQAAGSAFGSWETLGKMLRDVAAKKNKPEAPEASTE